MTKELEKLSGHIIVCGYGRIGRHLADGLNEARKRVVVVERDHDLVAEARSHGLLCVHGNATEEQVLIEAGIERAAFLLSSLPSDADNVFITLTARNLNTQVQIICRAEQASTDRKLRQAGASRIVMPTIVSARQMVRMITRPSTADLMELVAESTFLDVELDELLVEDQCRLVGVTVAQTEAHRRHRLLVVAVKQADGACCSTPTPTTHSPSATS